MEQDGGFSCAAVRMIPCKCLVQIAVIVQVSFILLGHVHQVYYD